MSLITRFLNLFSAQSHGLSKTNIKTPMPLTKTPLTEGLHKGMIKGSKQSKHRPVSPPPKPKM